ncbi:hypothetical protein DPMN_025648 [Dreissena polymorpha]|uniref:Uncharacterized protein n=1 Tax=Dreissena polymorpha TaxID=45954 RepID=A0A9D4LR39_DREPO|nr:hypothetical protein DPMN_025648 [Dreissena polymorpha]
MGKFIGLRSPDITFTHCTIRFPIQTTNSSRIVTVKVGRFEFSNTAVLASQSPKDIPGGSRTFQDRNGVTRRLQGLHAGL